MAVNAGPRAFIDSNIWLYAFIAANDPKRTAIAQQTIRATSAVVSTQVINEVCNNLLKKAAWNESQVARLVDAFYVRAEVIFLDRSLLLDASRLRTKFSLSFWDSLIIGSALQASVSTLLSEDLQHGLVIDARLTIVNPMMIP